VSDTVVLALTAPVALLIFVAGCVMIIAVLRARKGDLVALASVFADCLVRLAERLTRWHRALPAASPSAGDDGSGAA
jgi:hypothetical protein